MIGSAEIGDSVNIDVVCSDDNSVAFGYPKVWFYDDNNDLVGNYTMGLVNGSVYRRVYTFNTQGLYSNFTFMCKDGSGNTAMNTTTLSITVVDPDSSGDSSGGGGGGGSSSSGTCGLRITSPTNRLYNPYCTPGKADSEKRITVVNSATSTITVSSDYDGEIKGCSLFPENLRLAGGQTGYFTLKDCECPVEGEVLEGLVTLNSVGLDCESSVEVYIKGGYWYKFALWMGGIVLLVAGIALFIRWRLVE
jgi:hypothetical protein